MNKLELEMERRESAERASVAASRRTEEAHAKREQRQKRLFERKEFNRLFGRLRKMVDGRWDRHGWGWTFKYKGKEYWISYDSWSSPKTPGDADDYDMSGTHWVLKNHFSASEGDNGAYSLGDGVGKTGLTEEVLRGLGELTKRGGRRNERR
jgi:hypothetical protein